MIEVKLFRLWGYVLCFSALLLMVACCGSPAKAQEQGFDPIPYQDRMRDFSLHDLNGAIHHSKDYRNKTLLVVFWTMSCQACQADIAELEVAYQQLKRQGLEIIAIHAGGSAEEIKKLPGVQSIHYTILVDMDLRLGSWGVPSIPTAYVVDANGYRRYRSVGARDWSSPLMIETLKRIARRYD